MPFWLAVAGGLVLGVVLVGGAVYWAIRPYLGSRDPRPRLPDPTGEATPTQIPGTDGSWHAD